LIGVPRQRAVSLRPSWQALSWRGQGGWPWVRLALGEESNGITVIDWLARLFRRTMGCARSPSTAPDADTVDDPDRDERSGGDQQRPCAVGRADHDRGEPGSGAERRTTRRASAVGRSIAPSRAIRMVDLLGRGTVLAMVVAHKAGAGQGALGVPCPTQARVVAFPRQFPCLFRPLHRPHAR
jgi:hypothetical protein